MKNVVIYARYSCEKQNEQSIEGQLRVCNEFAERNGYLSCIITSTEPLQEKQTIERNFSVCSKTVRMTHSIT